MPWPKGKGGLTAKQEAFVQEYMVDLNASQAALRAGYSPHTADRIGQENLHKPVIKRALAYQKQERAEKTGIDAAWVLQELAKQYQKAEAAEDVPGASLKALDLIGRHVGVNAFNEKAGGQNAGVTINLNTSGPPLINQGVTIDHEE